MCNVGIMEFFMEAVQCEEFQGKRVLEVGSKYVNGSVRPLIEKFCKPKEYIGVDIEEGKFVDIVLPAEKLVEKFGENSFDALISTEMLEHVRDWRSVVNNMKLVVRPMGYIYISTRSLGFPYHACPYDFWRYEIVDFARIFNDFEIIKLVKDPFEPGVFLKARKPIYFKMTDLSYIALYSIITRKRTREIPNKLSPFRSIQVRAKEKFWRIAISIYHRFMK